MGYKRRLVQKEAGKILVCLKYASQLRGRRKPSYE